MLQDILKSKFAKPVLFVLFLVPLASLIWRGFYGDLGANPIETITRLRYHLLDSGSGYPDYCVFGACLVFTCFSMPAAISRSGLFSIMHSTSPT